VQPFLYLLPLGGPGAAVPRGVMADQVLVYPRKARQRNIGKEAFVVRKKTLYVVLKDKLVIAGGNIAQFLLYFQALMGGLPALLYRIANARNEFVPLGMGAIVSRFALYDYFDFFPFHMAMF